METLFKRSPVKANGAAAIEKLIVDLLFDENLYSLYSGMDVQRAVEELCTTYLINYRTLLGYASRKGMKERLLEAIRHYLPHEILKVVENDKQAELRKGSSRADGSGIRPF